MKKIFALVVSMAIVFTPAAAYADKKNDIIRFAFAQSPESIDPYFSISRLGVIVGQHVWDTLVYRDPASGELKGSLAVAWRQVDDRTFEFDLRQGVKFHNGKELTADDVVYTFNYVSTPGNHINYQQYVGWIERAKKIDKYKVQVTSKKSFAPALSYLSLPLVIDQQGYYDGPDVPGSSKTPIGTGPYKVVEYEAGKVLVLERNDEYFDGPKSKGRVKRIEIRFIPDMQTQVAELLSGGVDLIMGLPQDQALQLREAPGVQIAYGETMRINFLEMNIQEGTPSPQLKDERVRKAIIYAIDREAIVKNIIGGGARVLHTICFPSQIACTDEGATKYPYDPVKAKQLLAEAGYPNGFDIDIASYREREQTEAIIGYLRAVGIRANLKFMQINAMRDLLAGNKAMIASQSGASGSIRDASAATPLYFGKGSAVDVTKDADLHRLFETGDSEMNAEKRASMYKEALGIIADRAYAAPLWTLPVYYAAAEDLVFSPSEEELPHFWDMYWK